MIWRHIFQVNEKIARCNKKYARYNTYEHVHINNLFKKDKSLAEDLITNGYGASNSGDSFRDLTSEYLN